jgi:uncharacterized damage-inducible protein DinB
MFEIITNLQNHNHWANNRIMDCCELLTQEQYHGPSMGNFGSVHATLVHIIAVQYLWLQRWQEYSPKAVFDAKDFAGLPAVRTRWQEIEQKTLHFLQQCDDEVLQEKRTYQNFKGDPWSYPLWQMMIHQTNHATQHRSEIAMLLTEWGHSPGMLDFLYFMDIKSVPPALPMA